MQLVQVNSQRTKQFLEQVTRQTCQRFSTKSDISRILLFNCFFGMLGNLLSRDSTILFMPWVEDWIVRTWRKHISGEVRDKIKVYEAPIINPSYGKARLLTNSGMSESGRTEQFFFCRLEASRSSLRLTSTGGSEGGLISISGEQIWIRRACKQICSSLCLALGVGFSSQTMRK